MKSLSLVIFALALSGLAAPVLAAEAPTSSPKEKLAEEFGKNIQVFRGTPRSQFMGAMRFMAQSLGTTCDHCHVTSEEGSWPMEKDDKEAKRTARKMIEMVRAINAANFGGRTVVTCASCHRGQPEPVGVPPIPALGSAKVSDESPKEAVPLPKAAELLGRYVEALGGARAIAKVETVALDGHLLGESGKSYGLRVRYKSPDRYLEMIQQSDGEELYGYDGSVAWGKAGASGWRMRVAEEVARMERAAELFPALSIASLPGETRTVERENVGGAAAYLVVADLAPGKREKLDFDAATGLLSRRVVLTESPLGWFAEEADFDDWRAVGAVKLPFVIRRMEINTRWTEKFETASAGGALDPAMFDPPPEKKKPTS